MKGWNKEGYLFNDIKKYKKSYIPFMPTDGYDKNVCAMKRVMFVLRTNVALFFDGTEDYL